MASGFEGGAMTRLPMTNPKQDSADAAQTKSARKKPGCPWYADQNHQKDAEHNDQPDWVSRVKAGTVKPERDDPGQVRL